jgi:hypothetical protein
MSHAIPVTPLPHAPMPTQAAYPAGQRLMCEQCGAEIEIIKPCPCQPPEQVLQCCGKDMRPAP